MRDDEHRDVHVRFFQVVAGTDFLRAQIVDDFLKEYDIRRMSWSSKHADLNPIKHVQYCVGIAIIRRHHFPSKS